MSCEPRVNKDASQARPFGRFRSLRAGSCSARLAQVLRRTKEMRLRMTTGLGCSEFMLEARSC